MNTNVARRFISTALASVTLAVPAVVIITLGSGSFTHQLDTVAPVSATTTHVAPCAEEDGSGQFACVWDGKTAGNGVGRSYIALRGGTDHARYVYVSHRVARQLIRGAR